MRHFYYAGLLGLCVLSLQACGGGASGAAEAAATSQNTVVETAAATCAWDDTEMDECEWE